MKPDTEKTVDSIHFLIILVIGVTSMVNGFQTDRIKLLEEVSIAQDVRMNSLQSQINENFKFGFDFAKGQTEFNAKIANDFYDINISMPDFNKTK